MTKRSYLRLCLAIFGSYGCAVGPRFKVGKLSNFDGSHSVVSALGYISKVSNCKTNGRLRERRQFDLFKLRPLLVWPDR
jgi:hypothetical protein